MRPITRETILDRRQPVLRWSAVFAGAGVAVALWGLLQIIGMGAGLTAINLDDSGSVRSVGIGTGVWSLLAPLIAMFAGGFLAGKLATTFDSKVGATHGLVTWAFASIVGVVAVAWLISSIASGAAHMAYGELPTSNNISIDPNLRAHDIAEATDKTGKLLLGAGVTVLLSLGAAVAGGMAAVRHLTRPRHRTQEVPVVPPPAEPPTDAPHVTSH